MKYFYNQAIKYIEINKHEYIFKLSLITIKKLFKKINEITPNTIAIYTNNLSDIIRILLVLNFKRHFYLVKKILDI